MTEQEQYNKFWRTIAEKTADIQMEYNKLSETNKRQVDSIVQFTLRTHCVAGLFELIGNPLQFYSWK